MSRTGYQHLPKKLSEHVVWGLGLFNEDRERKKNELPDTRRIRHMIQDTICEISKILDKQTVKQKDSMLMDLLQYVSGFRVWLSEQEGDEWKSAEIPKWLINENEYPNLGHIFDHQSKGKNKNEFVSRPYGVSGEDLEKVIQYCKSKNISIYISGDSQWYPGRTCEVTFTRELK